MAHALIRTNPKGQPFRGSCMKCGLENIPISRMHEECANVAVLSQEDCLIFAVTGEPKENADASSKTLGGLK